MAKRTKPMVGVILCPNRHAIGTVHETGTCTPVYCPLSIARVPKALGEVANTANAELEAMLPAAAVEAKEVANDAGKQEIVKLSLAAGRRAARKAFSKVPENMDAEEAETWAKTTAAQSLPYAIAELQQQLFFGDDKQRADAAHDFLDINGMRKREGGQGGGATIILNLGGKELPWATKVVEKLNAKEIVDVDD